MERLRKLLESLEGRGYKAYKQLQGRYDFRAFTLSIDHVQGDPFALPSKISLQLTPEQHGLPGSLWDSPIRRIALEDFLGRAVASAITRWVRGDRGTGRSGSMQIATSGQQILKRNAAVMDDLQLDVRLLLALPGAGRTILAAEAAVMLFDELPQVVAEALIWNRRDVTQMLRHIECCVDQQALRDQLDELNGVAFIADQALLPRRSGIDDRPLAEGVPFRSPPELRRTLNLPHAGEISGMLIPAGVTLIVGGGYHGKSTLLEALERGVYNHLPGDGRERLATIDSAVKIRAEDHRAIHQVDISPFIDTLPGGRDTRSFSSDNASGSTSQAANIIEALACGCRCLMIDEDTSATNFMIRDHRMQQLVPNSREPITPLLHRVRELHRHHGVSTILVTGGSGDYLAVADRVIMLDHYRIRDVSDQARRFAGPPPPPPASRRPFNLHTIRRQSLIPLPRPGQHQVKIQVREPRLLEYGRTRIDLSRVEQLLDPGQTEAIGLLLARCHQQDPEQQDGLMAVLQRALQDIETQGLDLLLPWKAGHLALPRLYELAAAANRLRYAKGDENPP